MNFRLQYGRPAVDIIARLGRQLARLDFPRDAPHPLAAGSRVERASAGDGGFAHIQRWTQWITPRAVRPQTAFWVVPPHVGAALDSTRPHDGVQQ